MKTVFLLLSTLLLTACITSPEKECGMYDFDCRDEPAGDALITPAQKTSAVTTSAPTRQQASSQDVQTREGVADLNTRIELLEEEQRRLRRRVDALER